jgi:hypothetical protein
MVRLNTGIQADRKFNRMAQSIPGGYTPVNRVGLRGSTLVEGVLSATATRDAGQIDLYLQGLMP